MLVEKNKKEIKFLKSLGFKKTHFEDKSGFWFTLKFKSKLFGQCEIDIEDFNNEAIIVVDTFDKVDSSGGLVTVINAKYSRKKLIKILGTLL